MIRKIYPYLKAAVSGAALILSIILAPRPFLIAALIFCVTGDLFLAWSGELDRKKHEPFFTLGIASFGIAHVFLILFFVSVSGLHPTILSAVPLSCPLILGIKTGFIVPEKYRRRIIIYDFLVSLMPAAAISTPYFAGALLFWISDGLLAVWYFHKRTPFRLGGIALILYYASLYLII